MHPNPYEASVLPDAAADSNVVDASDLIKVWERRRLPYNALLAVATVVLGMLVRPGALDNAAFWGMVVEGAIGANVCYCVGPVAHWHLLRWIAPYRATGNALFWARTLLSMVLVAIAIVGATLP